MDSQAKIAADEKRLVYEATVDVAREETHREIAKLYEKLAEKELDARSAYTGTMNTQPRSDSRAMMECARHNSIADQYEDRGSLDRRCAARIRLETRWWTICRRRRFGTRREHHGQRCYGRARLRNCEPKSASNVVKLAR